MCLEKFFCILCRVFLIVVLLKKKVSCQAYPQRPLIYHFKYPRIIFVENTVSTPIPLTPLTKKNPHHNTFRQIFLSFKIFLSKRFPRFYSHRPSLVTIKKMKLRLIAKKYVVQQALCLYTEILLFNILLSYVFLIGMVFLFKNIYRNPLKITDFWLFEN